MSMLTAKEIKFWLEKIYPIELENLTRKYMEKKIVFNPENKTRLTFKGMDRKEAEELARKELEPIKEKYEKMLMQIKSQSNIVDWGIFKEAKEKKIKLPKPIKPTKTKIKKYPGSPRDPESYKRKLYIPVRFIRADERVRGGFPNDYLLLIDLIRKSKINGQKIIEGDIKCTINVRREFSNNCQLCISQDGHSVPFDLLIDPDPALSGTWAVRHPNCRCLLVMKFKAKPIKIEGENIVLGELNNYTVTMGYEFGVQGEGFMDDVSDPFDRARKMGKVESEQILII